MLEQTLRHFRRYQEIVSVFIRNGFGFILFEHLGFGGNRASAEVDLVQLGQRIRQALGELGPTFMKIGQFASTRPDIIPKPILKELEQLQDRAPLIRFENVRRTVEQELGAPITELFREFSPLPLAAASIGQVHYAVLHTGEPVVVKVQRPNISTVIQTDLEIMQDIVTLIEQRLPKAKDYALHGMLKEFSGWLEKELDYTTEGKNAEKMAQGFEGDPLVIVPCIFWKFTTRRVLTMAYIDGVKLNDRQKITALHYNKKIIAARISKALLQQIIRDGFFHGDPHPGNIFVLSGERIAFVDFGIVGNLTPLMKRRFANLISSLTRRDTKSMVKAMLQLGVVPQNVDLDRLRLDLDGIRRKHLDVPIAQTALPELVNDLLSMAFNHRIEIPSDFILIGKSLLTLQGIVHELDPSMSVAELAKPFRFQFIKEHFLIIKWVQKICKKKFN
ncbi:AarF/ABC1/UbiB kinase family protein [Desulfosporosinus sp. BG]|uniref:ABC1 kinase family protein n=1 Tax=Desulfosporosinus sp. BG TaxID=1633135 RepID=UPI000855AA43|nr:AarF/ABC1/UbiB kinase family protein [Desulfosporosinus sp. BG]ODA42870.1 Ubiquinone biosynthesis monooxygenase UbiB [Desulfosporosinus sp. BG]